MKKIIGLVLAGVLLFGCATTKVNINTNVEDARVIIDGKLLGQTPIESVKIKNTTRTYQAVIEKEGYKTYQGNLRTETNTPAVVAIVFGYTFSFLILPLLLFINANYVIKPVADQYFVLEEN